MNVFQLVRAFRSLLAPDLYYEHRRQKERAEELSLRWREACDQIARLSGELAEKSRAFATLSQQVADGVDLSAIVWDAADLEGSWKKRAIAYAQSEREARTAVRFLRDVLLAFKPVATEESARRIDAALLLTEHADSRPSQTPAQPSGGGQICESRAGVGDAQSVQANPSGVQRGDTESAGASPEAGGHARGGNGGA